MGQQFKHKNNQESFNRLVMDAIFTRVTLSAASRYSAVKLTTDSHQLFLLFYILLSLCHIKYIIQFRRLQQSNTIHCMTCQQI